MASSLREEFKVILQDETWLTSELISKLFAKVREKIEKKKKENPYMNIIRAYGYDRACDDIIEELK